ncbi:type I polyketide synthase [Vitiosangium sp. GDMCC 1.1324]|uniref:type I polyketide synthase n=1 Tax=Vitiosangium sp. (strain GDMCC 1.1324) TaxID=2138576 RepID=UPI000D37CADC|nr:type I polyketide synthase [Vitiosangium sp. GDMCC 1.1324]PTL78227.1 beta-ketoacyl synthase [Vitiosangium sp. GDMCC 1.1324]
MSEEINYRQLLQQQLVKIRKLETRLEQAEAARREPIAIVGMACRLPGGVESPEDFWDLQVKGVDATSEVPPDRWDAESLYDPDPRAPGKILTRRGAFLKDVDRFDARFFGISPREAESMDPQQRLVLEVGWEALERAGHAVVRARRDRVGVFVGVMNNDYGQLALYAGGPQGIDPYFIGARANCAISGRLSYLFGFQGPSMVVDTACSSSLVAVHLASQSLRNGECSMALAAGVNLLLSPEASIYLSCSGALSPDGRCKTFDASADGYSRAEACGALVLERLSDARARGANILAVIRGSAVGHDGPSSSFTVPNGVAQQTVIRQAMQGAGVSPAEVSYLEAHGTGTAIGDPIEVEAMWSVLKEGRKGGESLWMGSVKTNIGYPEAASGIVGMMKVVLAMRNKQLPAHLHLKKPNPYIDWKGMGVKVPVELTAWEPTQGRRIAGVTSYGRTGTLAHVVLEEAPAPVEVRRELERPEHVLVLSARSAEALRAHAGRYARFLAASHLELGDMCFTAAAGRAHFEHRLAVVGGNAQQVREKLLAMEAGREVEGGVAGSVGGTVPAVAFVFGGEGERFSDTGRELYETQPAFREAVEKCGEALKGVLEKPLVQVLYGTESALLKEEAYGRAAVFAVEWALGRMWRAWGVVPQAVQGQGVGEYVAAVESGVLGLEEGLRLAVGKVPLVRVETARADGSERITLHPGEAEWKRLLRTLGALYVKGVEVDWAAFDAPYSRRRVTLPTYPFQRERYWLSRGRERDPAHR